MLSEVEDIDSEEELRREEEERRKLMESIKLKHAQNTKAETALNEPTAVAPLTISQK